MPLTKYAVCVRPEETNLVCRTVTTHRSRVDMDMVREMRRVRSHALHNHTPTREHRSSSATAHKALCKKLPTITAHTARLSETGQSRKCTTITRSARLHLSLKYDCSLLAWEAILVQPHGTRPRARKQHSHPHASACSHGTTHKPLCGICTVQSNTLQQQESMCLRERV